MLLLAARLLISVTFGIILGALLNRLFSAFLVAGAFSAVLAAVLAYFLGRSGIRKDADLVGANTKNGFAVLSSLLVFFATLFLLTFGPLNVDRSFSVWMLRNIAEQDRISTASLKKQASDFFNPSSGEIERRVNEQLDLGIIEIDDGAVELTPRGEILVHINEAMARFFGLNPYYAIGGE